MNIFITISFHLYNSSCFLLFTYLFILVVLPHSFAQTHTPNKHVHTPSILFSPSPPICYMCRRSARQSARGDNTYHYISYLPIGGHLWELDGFKRGPLRLGKSGELKKKKEKREGELIAIWWVIEYLCV